MHQKLGYEKISKLLWQYSLPATIGTVVNALYNIVDRIYIGHDAGSYAIAGMAVTFPIMNLLAAFGMLVGQGAASQISLHLGRGDHNTANKILGNANMLAIAIFAFVSTFFYIFLDELLVAFGATENTMHYASEYMKIIVPFHVLTCLSFSGNNMMRASGFPTKAMWLMILGAALNVILDPIFIFGFNLGIKGAAIASVISMSISSLWVIIHFSNKKNTIHYQKSSFIPNWKIIGNITAIGLSPFLLQIGTSMINMFMNYSLLKYGGDLAIGAFGIVTSIALLIVMAIVGICQGSQPILGYNYGMGQYNRVRTTLKYTICIATTLTTASWILCETIPGYIAMAFGCENELISVTKIGMRLYMCVFFLVGSHIVITNYFQSIGKASISILLSLSRQIIFTLPFIAILPQFFGLNGLWLAEPAANILAVTMAIYTITKHIQKTKAL